MLNALKVGFEYDGSDGRKDDDLSSWDGSAPVSCEGKMGNLLRLLAFFGV